MTQAEMAIETEDRKRERDNEYRYDVAAYERAGEPDGCFYCGSDLHRSSDCKSL